MFSDPLAYKSDQNPISPQNQYIVDETGDDNKDNHQYGNSVAYVCGTGWRKLHVVGKQVQMQYKASVWYISNIFVFSLSGFLSDQTIDERWRQRQDTGGNIKKAGHLGQDIVCKEQM